MLKKLTLRPRRDGKLLVLHIEKDEEAQEAADFFDAEIVSIGPSTYGRDIVNALVGKLDPTEYPGTQPTSTYYTGDWRQDTARSFQEWFQNSLYDRN